MSGYPTDDEVATVRTWKFEHPGSFETFMAYVKAIGSYWPTHAFGWKQDGRTFHLSTGGWSGNEEIIDAMNSNFAFWMVCWQEHRRGGHYVFMLPDPLTYWATPGQP